MEPPETLESRLDWLVEHWLDEDGYPAYLAGTELFDLGRPALERARALTRDPRPQIRAIACYMLGQMPDPDVPQPDMPRIVYSREGLPDLLRLLEDDPEEDVRASAANALRQQAHPSTLPALCRAAADTSSQVRLDVALALGSYSEIHWADPAAAAHRGEVAQTLLGLMGDADTHVRRCAIGGISHGNHDTPQARTRLWQALEDTDLDVRAEALAGLAEFGDRGIVHLLERLLREGPGISLGWFRAAASLGDPALLPAVLAGAARRHATMEEGARMPRDIIVAIGSLESALRAGSLPAAGADCRGSDAEP